MSLDSSQMGKASHFTIPDPLWEVLHVFETECVGECCGRGAFDFENSHAFKMLNRDFTQDQISQALRQLADLAQSMRTISEPVSIEMIRDKWTGIQASEWLVEIQRAFAAHGYAAR